MAITGGAAIVGAVAAGSGYVAVSTVVIAGLALTAVGAITGNKLLSKIGGGLSIGSGVGGLAAGGAGAAGAAAGATDSTTAAIGADSAVTTGAGAGSQAAGDLADSTLGATGSGAPMGFGAASGVDAATGAQVGATGLATATDAATGVAPVLGTSANTGVSPVDNALSAAGNNTIDSSLASQSPAQSLIAGNQTTPVAAPVNANAANVNAANVNPVNSIAANTAAAAPTTTAPAPAAASASATTGSGAPVAFGSTGANAVTQDSSSWMGNLWNSLDAHGKLAVGQTAAGLVSGVGQGAMNAIAAGKKTALDKQQTFEQNNMTGASSVPTVNMAPVAGAASPYATPTQVNQNAQAATAPITQLTAAQKGLIKGVQN